MDSAELQAAVELAGGSLQQKKRQRCAEAGHVEKAAHRLGGLIGEQLLLSAPRRSSQGRV